MKRLYFMARDTDSARQTVDELLLARVEERRIHVLAKEGIPLENLPEASIFQKTDLAHGVEQGLALGGAAGAFAGLVTITLPGAGLVLGGGAVLLATTLAGAGIGAWAASFRALNIPNTHLQEFQEDLEKGCILIMVDLPKERVDQVRERIARTGVSDRGIDSTFHYPGD